MTATETRMDHLLQAAGFLFQPGDVVEIRAPKAGREKTISGYTSDPQILAKLALAVDRKAQGVYWTLNLVNPQLQARAANKLKSYAEQTTTDRDILIRRNLLLDIDAIRPSGISSTDAEHQAALRLAHRIRRDLMAEGWPEPLVQDSGNGGYLIFRLPDLPNNESSTNLVKAVLQVLGKRFDTSAAKIDQSPSNAARIAKIPGTTAMKGDSTVDRPHRVSLLLDVPERAEPVPLELLEQMAATAKPAEAKTKPAPEPASSTTTTDQWMDDWLARVAIEIIKGPYTKDGGRQWDVRCPFDPEHGNRGDASIFQAANGKLGYHCFHESCAKYGWRDVRELFEGPRPRANSPKSDPPADEDAAEPQAAIIRKFCAQLQLAGGFTDERLRAAAHAFNGQCPSPLDAGQVDEIVNWTLENIRSGAGGGQTTTSAAVDWENLIPLESRVVPEIKPEWLPGPLRNMAVATAKASETPLEMPALLGVSVVSCTLAGKIEIAVEPGYCEPANVYVATAMTSGNRKTFVADAMTRPLNDYESAERRRLEPEIKRALNKRKMAEERIAWLRKKAAKSPANASLVQEIADAEETLPVVPRVPQLWTQDTTSEKLAQLLQDHGERMGLFSDEGDIFEVLAGRYNAGVPNFDIYLHAHSASPVRVSRISRPDLFLDKPMLSIGLSPQPSVLEHLRATPSFRSRGLLARFLFALPPSSLGDRTLIPQPCPAAVRDAYRELITRLIRLTPPTCDEVWQPWRLEFSEEAYTAWKQFQREVESMMRADGKLERLHDWGSKLPGAVVRLAGLFHAVVAEDLTCNLVISRDTTDCAIKLGTALIGHALAVFDLMERDPVFEAAGKVLEWIRRGRQQTFTLRECFHALQKRFKRVAALRPALELLQEHGFLRRAPKTSAPNRPSEIFEVNPRLLKEAE